MRDEEAFYSGAERGNQPQRRKNDSNRSKKDRSCYNCQKVGHYAANCPEKATQKSNKGRAMCAVLAVGDVDQGEWYFDSGATTHMARPGWNLRGKQEISCQVGTANKASMMAKVKGVVELRACGYSRCPRSPGFGSKFVVSQQDMQQRLYGDVHSKRMHGAG